jgi:hypothetical protein
MTKSGILLVGPDGLATLRGQAVPAGVARMGITNIPGPHQWRHHRIDVDVAVLDRGTQTNHPKQNPSCATPHLDSQGHVLTSLQVAT